MFSLYKRFKGLFYSVLFWLCILSFFSVLNEMVLNVSLPDIANHFNTTPGITNWVNTAYMLTFSIGTAVYGKLSDYINIKKLLIIGISLSCLGSLIAFIGHNHFFILIFGRLVQGVGSAAFPSLIMVVVARNITRKKQGKAFGFIGSIVALGEGLGPSIGGIIAHYIHWSYLLILPMITIVTIPFLIKVMVPGKSTKNTLDIVGIVLMSISIICFMLFTTNYNWTFLILFTIFFVINSIDLETGKKYQSNKKQREFVKQENDEVCREHGLSVPERNATMRYTQAEKGLIEKGKSSWKDEIRDAIEQSQATNFEELERELNQLDITIDRVTNKTITYRHLKENKKVRGKNLGEQFDKGALENEFAVANERREFEQQLSKHEPTETEHRFRDTETHFERPRKLRIKSREDDFELE